MKNPSQPRRVHLLAAVTAVAAMAMSACGSSSGGSSSSGDYVIGFNDDLSGPISFAGLTNLAGVETYLDYVNDTEGGVNGHKIVLKKLDSKGDGATSLANARQLVADDDAIAILGNSASGAWAASAPLADQQKVPQMGYGNADDYFVKYDPYLFKNGMVVSQQVSLIAQVIKDYVFKGSSDGLKVAVLTIDTASGDPYIEATDDVAKDEGWSVVETQKVSIGATDCTAQAAKIAAAGPDVVIANVTSVGEDIVCFKQLQARGYDGPVIDNNSSSAETTFKTLASPNWMALRLYNWWEDTSEKGTSDLLAQAKKYGTEKALGAYSSDGYVAAMAVVAALKECGDDCDGPAVQKGLEGLKDLDTQGIAGPAFGFTTGDLGHTIPQARAYVWDPDQGKSVPVTDWLCLPDRDC